MNKLKIWLIKKLCAHEFKEAIALGVREESCSGFKVHYEVYTMKCVRCAHAILVSNKEDAEHVLRESNDFHTHRNN